MSRYEYECKKCGITFVTSSLAMLKAMGDHREECSIGDSDG